MAKQESKSMRPLSMSFGKAVLLFAVTGMSVPTSALATAEARVWVARSSGTLQCDEKTSDPKADPLVKARDRLVKSGVRVIEAKKRNDGRIRAQMCGMSDGDETAFLIPRSDLKKAMALGFESAR